MPLSNTYILFALALCRQLLHVQMIDSTRHQTPKSCRLCDWVLQSSANKDTGT